MELVEVCQSQLRINLSNLFCITWILYIFFCRFKTMDFNTLLYFWIDKRIIYLSHNWLRYLILNMIEDSKIFKVDYIQGQHAHSIFNISSKHTPRHWKDLKRATSITLAFIWSKYVVRVWLHEIVQSAFFPYSLFIYCVQPIIQISEFFGIINQIIQISVMHN